MIQANDIFKKVGFILNELQDQYEYLAHHPEKISPPELELFIANANFLADHIKIYSRLEYETNKATPQAPVVATDATAIAEDAADVAGGDRLPDLETDAENADMQLEETTFSVTKEVEAFKLDTTPPPFEFVLSEAGPENNIEPEVASVAETFEDVLVSPEEKTEPAVLMEADESAPEETDEIGPEPFLVSEDVEKADVVTTQETSETNGKAVSALKPTLNELLAKNTGANPKATAHKNTITDLKKAINLNDKLLYIKDLFNGYNLAYAEAIEIINKMPDFAAADKFLQKNYAVKNGWSEKQNTVDQFYELLNQRFPVQE